MPRTATADHVERQALLEFLRPRPQAVQLTRRREGRRARPHGSAGAGTGGVPAAVIDKL